MADENEYYTLSVNILGGIVGITAGYDGIDSNGNVNIVAGMVTINARSNGGDAGIDYDDKLYISDTAELTNPGGIAGPDMQPGQQGQMDPGGQPGDMPEMPNDGMEPPNGDDSNRPEPPNRPGN